MKQIHGFHTYGYRSDLTQASVDVPLVFTPPSLMAIDRLDHWLREWFDTTAPSVSEVWSLKASTGLRFTPLPAWLSRVLAIYGMLCQAGDLPAVAPGRLVGLAKHGAQWRAVLRVPVVNGPSPRIFHDLVKASMSLAAMLMRTAPSFDQAQRVYDQLENQVLKHLRRQLPGGRANGLVARLAHRQGIPFTHLGSGVMQLGYGARAQLTHRSACLEDSAIAARICADKVSTALLLAQAGLPVPEHERVGSIDQAKAVAERLGWPVVVKPADRERGEGVSMHVDSVDSLRVAYQRATAASSQVLVERQVPGVCHRLFVAGGELLYASRREGKLVKGDGWRTVRHLVADANEMEMRRPPWLRLKAFPLDELTLACLARVGLTPDSVPEEGQCAPLRPFTSTEWGGSAEDVTAQVHPQNVSLAVQAATQLGLTVAGVDLIATDIQRPWYDTGAMINEVNFTPYLGGALNEDNAGGYLRALVRGEGRIPVHAVAGTGDLWGRARELQEHMTTEGIRAHLCGAQWAESPEGERLALVSEGLFQRSLALLRRRDVEALILVIEGDEFLQSGLPVDRLDGLHTLSHDESGASSRFEEMLAAFVCEPAEPKPLPCDRAAMGIKLPQV